MADLSVDIQARFGTVVDQMTDLEKSTQGVNASMIQLGKTGVVLEGITGRFFKVIQEGNETWKKSISAQEGLNAIGIKTGKQLARQISVVKQLIRVHQDDAAAVAQLTAKLRLLEATSGDATGSFGRLNRRMGSTSSIAFQAGQAVSDFAVAGIRGAANNIEFLALQLGASGPLILGITAATVALTVFADDIARIFNGAKELTNETKEAFADMFQVIETGSDDAIVALDSQLGDLVEVQKAVIKSIEEDIIKEFGDLNFRQILPGLSVGELTDLEKDLAEARGILEELDDRQRQSERRRRVAAAAEKNEQLQLNEAKLESVRLDIELAGFKKEAAKLSKEELANLLDQQKLQEFIADLQKKNTSRRQTEFEKASSNNKRLKEQLEALTNADQSRLGKLILQNEELARQIKNTKEQIRLREFLAGIDFLPSPPVQQFQEGIFSASAETGDLPGEGIDSIFGKLKPIAIQVEQVAMEVSQTAKELGVDLQELTDSQFDAFQRIVSGADLSAAAFDRAGISSREFFQNTTEGAIVAAGILSNAAGTFQSAFSTAYEVAGEKAGVFFELSKAFGIAEATISTYEGANKALAKLPPPLSFITAGAIVAAGLANVAKIASTRPGSSGGGASIPGGVGSSPSGRFGDAESRRTQRPPADPRQGRDGRFRRNLSTFNSGFEPQAPFPVDLSGVVDFHLVGEDLIGSWTKTKQRQDRTRGPQREATRLGRGRRGGR